MGFQIFFCLRIGLIFGHCRVLLDDVDNTGKNGGDGYINYGINPTKGAIVIVRPDGYVGALAEFNGIEAIVAYFSAFMAVSV